VPDARLILVPRHPARVADVERLCRAEGFRCARQSAPHADDPSAAVVLGDTMGELIYLYGTAAVAFVGGSFCGLGGHNPIEPALCGVPVVMGPDDFNFTDVVAVFRETEGLVVVTETVELADRVAEWLTDTQAARAAGQRARRAVAAQRGATGRLQTLLQSQIDTLH
jgi:3-deoxy-D-manno-octulosonic-acid transferase